MSAVHTDQAPVATPTSWTARVRERISHIVPPGQALPDRQPAYMSSWIYVFGVLTLAGLVVVVASGVVRSWWSTSGASSGWPHGVATGP
jgi:hypothetical protein